MNSTLTFNFGAETRSPLTLWPLILILFLFFHVIFFHSLKEKNQRVTIPSQVRKPECQLQKTRMRTM